MPVPIRSGVLQEVPYPRPAGDLRGVPFHGLMGWGMGDPDALVRRADLVVAVDVMTGEELLVYGEVALFLVEFGGRAATFRVLAVELDFDTAEVDVVAALVEAVKGEHDLPWEID